MELQTFKEFESNVEACHGSSKCSESDTSLLGKVLIAFTYEGGRLNAAHLRMSPDEARAMAAALLLNANRLDPK